jgi:hypothetical protein
MRISWLAFALWFHTSDLIAAERAVPLGVVSNSHQAELQRAPPTVVDATANVNDPVSSDGTNPGRGSGSAPATALPGPASAMTRSVGTAAAAVSSPSTQLPAPISNSSAATPCSDCADAQHLHGERSRLEAEKQLLTLEIDIATLRKKLNELEAGPRPAAGSATSVVSIAEPPPVVLSRRGFDGRFSALVRTSSGDKLVVHAGDKLPYGRIDAIDGQGVLATWYGRRIRLQDVEADEPSSNGAPTGRNLDLTLPAAPPAVSAR